MQFKMQTEKLTKKISDFYVASTLEFDFQSATLNSTGTNRYFVLWIINLVAHIQFRCYYTKTTKV